MHAGVGPVAATAELTDTVAAQIPRPLVDGQVELDLSSSLRYVNWLMYSSESPVFMVRGKNGIISLGQGGVRIANHEADSSSLHPGLARQVGEYKRERS